MRAQDALSGWNGDSGLRGRQAGSLMHLHPPGSSLPRWQLSFGCCLSPTNEETRDLKAPRLSEGPHRELRSGLESPPTSAPC